MHTQPQNDTIPHPYHLVTPSPWPILGAFAAGLLAVGAILYMHNGPQWVLFLGFLCVFLVMGLWWRSVIQESTKQKVHTEVVKIGLRYGMVLFIATEVMFFVGFFWAFFNASIFPRIVDPDLYPVWWFLEPEAGVVINPALNPQGLWPPPGVHVISTFDLPLTMTCILLLSGCTITWAHHALIAGKQQETVQALTLTILLGLLFLSLQTYEYAYAHFGFGQGIYPSTFFIATGFHGLHVFIGTIFLTVCLFRTIKGHFTQHSHVGFEASAWYWHFVDVVWLFLFISIYWWGSIPK